MELRAATHLRRTGEGSRGVEVEFAGRRLQLTNLDKPMFQLSHLTKGEVIDYYARVAEAMLPHVARRPLTLKRFPDGVGGAYFFEKQCPRHRPDWVATVPIWIESYATDYRYCTITEPATLVWLANLASLEVHPALATAEDLARPTHLAFDLDPGYPAGLLEAGGVALLLRGTLDGVGLRSFVKSSGAKGLHVLVPLNTDVTYERTKAFARAVAQTLADRFGDSVLANLSRARRAGKVLIDWGQNDRHKTIAAPYSLRTMDPPTVSVPLGWQEVEAAIRSEDAGALVLGPEAMLARLEDEGELMAESATLRQRLPD